MILVIGKDIQNEFWQKLILDLREGFPAKKAGINSVASPERGGGG